MNWIKADIVPADWPIEGRNPPRGPFAPLEAQAINQWIAARSAEYGQALRFILSSGARINEALQLCADKVLLVGYSAADRLAIIHDAVGQLRRCWLGVFLLK